MDRERCAADIRNIVELLLIYYTGWKDGRGRGIQGGKMEEVGDSVDCRYLAIVTVSPAVPC